MAAVRTLRIGSRGSALALAQTRWVADAIRARAPEVRIEIVEIETTGDVVTDVPLGPSVGSSFFTKEIEHALLDGRVDLAVHSCKDLATVLPEGLVLAAVPVREDPRDVVVGPEGGLAGLPAGARVGTSSPRRKAFLVRARPDLVVVDQRGNVPTRVAAIDRGAFAAAVLAAAGLRRLGLSGRISETLGTDVMLPAAGQGALALQARAMDASTRQLARLVDDTASRGEVSAERACLRRLGAGCQAPVGALAHHDGGRLVLDAAVVAPDGVRRVRSIGAPADAAEIGATAGARLLASLGLASLRDAGWAGSEPRSTAVRG